MSNTSDTQMQTAGETNVKHVVGQLTRSKQKRPTGQPGTGNKAVVQVSYCIIKPVHNCRPHPERIGAVNTQLL